MVVERRRIGSFVLADFFACVIGGGQAKDKACLSNDIYYKPLIYKITVYRLVHFPRALVRSLGTCTRKGLKWTPVYQISTLSRDTWLVQPLAFSVLRIGRGRVVVGIPGKVYYERASLVHSPVGARYPYQ